MFPYFFLQSSNSRYIGQIFMDRTLPMYGNVGGPGGLFLLRFHSKRVRTVTAANRMTWVVSKSMLICLIAIAN